MSWLSRFTNVFRGDHLDRELNEELQYHIAERTAELVRDGMSPAEAFRAAQRRLGNQLALRESSRDAMLFPWLESLLRDARFGFRILRKDFTLTAAAILSLSLAIGACAATFSLLDALILRPLPVPEPSRLVTFSYRGTRPSTGARLDNDRFSYPMIETFRAAAAQQVDLFGLTVWGPLQPAVFQGAQPQAGTERLRTQWISRNGLEILGVRPVLGRLLSAGDDHIDPLRADAVISYAFWKRRFALNPGVLGRELNLSGTECRIVGVTQEQFTGVEPGYLIDLWLPLTTAASERQLRNPDNDRFVILGRLKPGVQAEQLRQILQAAFTNARQERAAELARTLAAGNRAGGSVYDQVSRFVHTRLDVHSAERGYETFVRWQFSKPLWILAAVVGLVLLIACSNVANLLVARAAARGREMAMRVALGAGRGRLVQQVLIESGLLAGGACFLGLLIASWIAPVLIGLMGTSADPVYLNVQPDLRTLAFLGAVGLLTTSLFGLAPALRASSAHASEALKEGDSKQSARLGVLRPVLAAQVGFSFVVLFLAGLLLVSFQRLTSVDLGFAQKNLLLFSIDAGGLGGPGSPGGLRKDPKARAVQIQLLDHLRHLSGVEAAGTSSFALMGGASTPVVSPPVRFSGEAPSRIRPQFLSVSPGFFSAMQIPLLSGRDFHADDSAPDRPTAAIVNQAFARQFFPGGEAVGKRFERMVDDDGHYAWQEIVGVVGDAKYNNLREPSAPTVYQPAAGVGAAVEVRTKGDPLAMAQRLRLEIQGVDPSLRVAEVTLQSRRIDETILQEHMLALLGGFLGLIAMVLAAVGLYGVLSYSVARRTREIGVRVALGATFGAVVRMVTKDVAGALLCGLAAGIAGGFLLARLVTSLLFDVQPSDAASVALPLICLLLASAAAAVPPAMRIARVDPMEALRYE